MYLVVYGENPVSSIASAFALISTNAVGASGFIEPSILIGELSLIFPSSETGAGVVDLVPNAPTLPSMSVRFAV